LDSRAPTRFEAPSTSTSDPSASTAKGVPPELEQPGAPAVVGGLLFEELATDRLADRGQGLSAEALRQLATDAVEIGLIDGVLGGQDPVVDDPGAIDQDRDDALRVQTDEFEVLDDDPPHVRDEHDADVLGNPESWRAASPRSSGISPRRW
jgi:hypothetical protein